MVPRMMSCAVAFAALGLLDVVSAMWSEFELRTVEDMNGTTSLPIIFGVRSKRIKKGSYGIAGTVTVTDDFAGYEAEVNVYHSAQGNNVFVQSPIKIPRGPLCGKVNDEYRKFLMGELHLVSNLPFSEDSKEDLCKIFEQKVYDVKDYMYDSSTIPKFLQPGLYKVHIRLLKDGALTSGVEATVILS